LKNLVSIKGLVGFGQLIATQEAIQKLNFQSELQFSELSLSVKILKSTCPSAIVFGIL